MAIWRFRSNFAINRADEAVYIRRARRKNEIPVLRDGLPVSNTRFLTAPLYRTPNHYFFNSLIGGRASSQRGRRSSLASQPTASLFMGSTGIETFSVRSQVEHSKVRSSNPRSPKETRANIILCLHTGHIGRSFSELMGLSPAIEARVYARSRATSINRKAVSCSNWCESAQGVRTLQMTGSNAIKTIEKSRSEWGHDRRRP